MSSSPLADALAALNDKPLPDMLSLYGLNVLCQPTTAEESLAAAILWATHELATGQYTLH